MYITLYIDLSIIFYHYIFYIVHMTKPVPVAARSKAWVCGRLLCWDYGFESRRGGGVHGYLSVVRVVCCEVFATGRSLVQGSLADCVVILSVISKTSTVRRPWFIMA